MDWREDDNRGAKDGFREAVDAGRDAVLQGAFNEGYSRGSKRGQLVGVVYGAAWCVVRLRGCFAPLTAWDARSAVLASSSHSLSASARALLEAHCSRVRSSMKGQMLSQETLDELDRSSDAAASCLHSVGFAVDLPEAAAAEAGGGEAAPCSAGAAESAPEE